MGDASHPRQSGEYETTGWYGERERGATVQCVHCQFTWVWSPGSGRTRGWCMKCQGFVCGKKCEECVHFMKKVENLEAGRPADFTPIRIFVPPGLDTGE